jgi:hypothetical protein
MQPIVRDGRRTPAHTRYEQFWHGTGFDLLGSSRRDLQILVLVQVSA